MQCNLSQGGILFNFFFVIIFLLTRFGAFVSYYIWLQVSNVYFTHNCGIGDGWCFHIIAVEGAMCPFFFGPL